jgi:hypothetical protein
MKQLTVFKQELAIAEGDRYPEWTLKQIWTAPFKLDDHMLRSIEDFSARGMFCQVADIPEHP